MLEGQFRMNRIEEGGKTKSCYAEKWHITSTRTQREAVVPLKISKFKGNLFASLTSFVWIKWMLSCPFHLLVCLALEFYFFYCDGHKGVVCPQESQTEGWHIFLKQIVNMIWEKMGMWYVGISATWVEISLCKQSDLLQTQDLSSMPVCNDTVWVCDVLHIFVSPLDV